MRTAEGIPAQAKFGERVPVPVTVFSPIATGGVPQQPVTSFNYENIGVNIDITPRVHHNDDVSLALKVEVSNVSGEGFGGLPTFGNRFINTVIRLKDGETNMLAGLIRDDERRVLDGVAGLSDLPVIGRLFGRTKRETQETDIILTLTPHIVRVLDLTEADLRPFRLGREGGGEPVHRGPDTHLRRSPRSRRMTCNARAGAAGAAPGHAHSAAGARRLHRRPPPAAAGTAAAAVSGLRQLGHSRAQRLQPLDEPAVAALDGLERAHAAFAIGRQRRRDERHARSQVAAVERPSAKP